MGLRDQIPEDLKTALRNRNSLELNVLRMLQAAIKNKEIENKDELNDELVIQVISSEIKKRRDSIEEFIKVGRNDAADIEKSEIDVLLKYMPEQLSEEEILEFVKKAISEVGASGLKDLGAVMKVLMPDLKGKADGKMVNKIVREELEKI